MKRSKGSSKEDSKKTQKSSEISKDMSKEQAADVLKTSTEGAKKPKKAEEKVEEVSSAREDSETSKSEKKKPGNKGILKTSTLAKFLPNAVTITAMCFGLSAIRFAHNNEWEYAVLCILVSALLDMFDGKIARLLDQSSSFGLELDSLSDLVCFGVAPSVVLYLAAMQQIGKVGWGICMFYTICCAMRLARFNVSHSGQVSELDQKYFVGIPAPTGAIVALFPLILFFETESFPVVKPSFVAFFLMFAGCMMISTMRTFSSKIIEVNNTNSWITLATIAFIIICLITRLWMTLSVLVVFYIITIPYGIYRYCEAVKVAKTKE